MTGTGFGHGEEIWLIVGVLITAPAVTGFTLAYGLLLPWYRSMIGRALFTNSLGLTMLVLAGAIRLFVGSGNMIFQDLRLAIYTVLPVGSWFMLLAFARVLWANRAGALGTEIEQQGRRNDINDDMRSTKIDDARPSR